MRRAEFGLRKVSREPRDVLPAISRRMKFWKTERNLGETASAALKAASDRSVNGFYAEVFAHGLDFDAINRVLDSHGAKVIAYDGQFSTATFLRHLKPRIPGYTADNCNLRSALWGTRAETVDRKSSTKVTSGCVAGVRPYEAP